ncbi:GntR family transcriptional regulator [Spirilliplanes yamanashiensis]|uniref:GntR family transcriptional regulator n=1 Tax=Spirilliplanes yamanashiensis TaxID=42233 RepID=A0A8J4DH29_9ACTN|nr:GntR family transcriptional regulator [Spirilliplanes yamanashiensis]MDP9819409.1 DNA-binding GntR family transcriptional regulator [Spirilliplanes yamanashiensis]GIJ01767.1 GntR family transcriptional regulator [Spirilliplanes yamanashiensis]
MTDTQRAASAAERAHASIRAAIMRGELATGSMISENELAATLSMSRTPVRAALTRLQDEGWVTIYAQRGALVRELTADEVRESAETRNALESAGVRRADPAQRAGLAARLAENLDRQDAALAGGDLHEFAVAAMRFHRAFVELAGNGTMLAIYDRLQDRQFLSILRSAGRISGDPQLVTAEHRELLDHASRGDWAAFAAALDAHQARSHGLPTAW